MKIAGIDPSICSTGMTVMDLDDNLDIREMSFFGYTSIQKYAIEVDNVKITRLPPSAEYDSLSIPNRMELTYPIIMDAMQGVTYAGIEDYAISKAKRGSSSMIQIAEFCGGIRYELYKHGIGYLNYGITQIKRFATGKGSNEDDEKMPMCLAFKARYPQYYPEAAFSRLKQFESPMADLCDAFWMCEILHQHLRYEKYGEAGMTEADALFLTTTATAGATPLADSPIVMRGVKYNKIKRKKPAHKKREKEPKT